jgi:hypothetical protein
MSVTRRSFLSSCIALCFSPALPKPTLSLVTLNKAVEQTTFLLSEYFSDEALLERYYAIPVARWTAVLRENELTRIEFEFKELP